MALKKFDSINVIPLVDIMLVLLAIVLTTSTLIDKKLIPVALPEAKSATLNLAHKDIAITITKESKIFLKSEAVTVDALKEKIKSFDRNDSFLINCDKEAPFKNFVKVLEILKSQHFHNIAIVSKEDG